MIFRRRVIAIIALTSMGSLSGSLTAQSAPAASSTSATCELHVSGSGRPNHVIKKSIWIAGDIPSPEVQREQFRRSPFNAATRAQALPDDVLADLLPAHRDVTIVRHAQIVDTDVIDIRKRTARLYPSAAPCYADLILTEAGAIWTSHAAPSGLIPALAMGGDRAVVGFQLNIFERGAARPVIFKKKLATRLESPASDASKNPGRLTENLKASYAEALRQFAQFVATKRKA